MTIFDIYTTKASVRGGLQITQKLPMVHHNPNQLPRYLLLNTGTHINTDDGGPSAGLSGYVHFEQPTPSSISRSLPPPSALPTPTSTTHSSARPSTEQSATHVYTSSTAASYAVDDSPRPSAASATSHNGSHNALPPLKEAQLKQAPLNETPTLSLYAAATLIQKLVRGRRVCKAVSQLQKSQRSMPPHLFFIITLVLLYIKCLLLAVSVWLLVDFFVFGFPTLGNGETVRRAMYLNQDVLDCPGGARLKHVLGENAQALLDLRDGKRITAMPVERFPYLDVCKGNQDEYLSMNDFLDEGSNCTLKTSSFVPRNKDWEHVTHVLGADPATGLSPSQFELLTLRHYFPSGLRLLLMTNETCPVFFAPPRRGRSIPASSARERCARTPAVALQRLPVRGAERELRAHPADQNARTLQQPGHDLRHTDRRAHLQRLHRVLGGHGGRVRVQGQRHTRRLRTRLRLLAHRTGGGGHDWRTTSATTARPSHLTSSSCSPSWAPSWWTRSSSAWLRCREGLRATALQQHFEPPLGVFFVSTLLPGLAISFFGLYRLARPGRVAAASNSGVGDEYLYTALYLLMIPFYLWLLGSSMIYRWRPMRPKWGCSRWLWAKLLPGGNDPTQSQAAFHLDYWRFEHARNMHLSSANATITFFANIMYKYFPLLTPVLWGTVGAGLLYLHVGEARLRAGLKKAVKNHSMGQMERFRSTLGVHTSLAHVLAGESLRARNHDHMFVADSHRASDTTTTTQKSERQQGVEIVQLRWERASAGAESVDSWSTCVECQRAQAAALAAPPPAFPWLFLTNCVILHIFGYQLMANAIWLVPEEDDVHTSLAPSVRYLLFVLTALSPILFCFYPKRWLREDELAGTGRCADHRDPADKLRAYRQFFVLPSRVLLLPMVEINLSVAASRFAVTFLSFANYARALVGCLGAACFWLWHVGLMVDQSRTALRRPGQEAQPFFYTELLAEAAAISLSIQVMLDAVGGGADVSHSPIYPTSSKVLTSLMCLPLLYEDALHYWKLYARQSKGKQQQSRNAGNGPVCAACLARVATRRLRHTSSSPYN
eukprot:g65257.t1